MQRSLPENVAPVGVVVNLYFERRNYMTTKTKEEVIEALSCCARGDDCQHCPYDDVSNCHVISKHDAIYYLYKDSDDKKAVVTVISDEERRLRQAVKAQQQTINALLGI